MTKDEIIAMDEQIKKLKDELARLNAPKNGFYSNFKRIVHLRKLLIKLERKLEQDKT